ncbi:MAG: sel1 repeat family protein [Nitrospirae bacterium]|nr:sel1 repeat family protein [Nitrospirota bacterium]
MRVFLFILAVCCALAAPPVEFARAADDGRLPVLEALLERSAAGNPALSPDLTQAAAAVRAGRTDEAVERLTPLADAGDPWAQALLGEVLLRTGAPANLAKAIGSLTAAANGGVAEAAFWIAEYFDPAIGLWPDVEWARTWYQRSAEGGYAGAAYTLARNYYFGGPGLPADIAEAVRWYKVAAEGGEPLAARVLGELYWNGLGVAADRREALRWYQVAADHGDLEGLTLVGWALVTGEWLDADPPRGHALLDRAVRQGYPDAIGRKALTLFLGRGLEQDVDAAIHMLMPLAEAGDTLSQARLATFLSMTDDGADNLSRALRLARASAEQGDMAGQFELARLLITRDAIRDMNEGRRWLERAARTCLDQRAPDVANLIVPLLRAHFPDSPVLPELERMLAPLAGVLADPALLQRFVLGP